MATILEKFRINQKRRHSYTFKPYDVRRMRTQACSLFRFQQRCVLWLAKIRKQKKSNGAIENLDVGFGKTVISFYHAQQFGWNVLFLCPTNITSHAYREIRKHFGNAVTVSIANGWPCCFERPADIVIMSFYTISRLNENDVLFNNWRFKTCIIDEVQDAETKPGVKNAITKLIQADFFIGLTAGEKVTLAPICELLHARPDYRSIFTFRQPPVFNIQQVYLTMSSPHIIAQYEALKQNVILSKDTGLRKHQKLKDTWALLSLDKVTSAMEWLNKIPSHYKVVIVSNYVPTLRALAEKIPKTRYMLLDTKIQGQERRQQILDQFEKSPVTCTFLLASMEIIFLGINLGFADVLVKMDISYEADANLQLNGRFRRSGQSPRNVKVQHIVEFITKDTSDEKLFCSNQIAKH